MKLLILPVGVAGDVSTRIALTEGFSFEPVQGAAIGKSCFSAQWSRSDWKTEKLQTYWSRPGGWERSCSSSGW